MFTFKNKEEYLEYIKNWKKEYKILSIDIRKNRLKYKEVLRRRSWAWAEAQNCVPDDFQHRHYQLYRKQDELLAGDEAYQISLKEYVGVDSNRATEMLEELKSAKLESERQYLEQKKTVAKQKS